MKNIRKRLIAVAIIASMALTSVAGCSSDSVGKGGSASSSSSAESVDDNLDHVENEEGNVVITPFQTGSADDLAINDPNAPTDDDTTTAANANAKATTAIGTVTVTDAKGKTVTDAEGQKVTETYIATAANNGNSNNNNNNNNSNNSGNSDYKSSIDSMYCLWIDISKDENYVFNDQFIRIQFKIKEGIPEKDYPIRFNPDFSSVAGVSVHPDKVAQGTIRVGSGSIEPMDVSSEKNVACKPGDTIDYYLNLKDNPGLAAILVWFYYDKNAMEVVEVEPAGEFLDISDGVAQVGTRPSDN